MQSRLHVDVDSSEEERRIRLVDAIAVVVRSSRGSTRLAGKA